MDVDLKEIEIDERRTTVATPKRGSGGGCLR
jgi:hypothetical protein